MTPFGKIIRRAVETTPGAVGGAFAAADGEMVDCFAKAFGVSEWALITAHYGVILAQLRAAFGIWHFGSPEYFIAQHGSLGVVVHDVSAGYYALLAMTNHDPSSALPTLATAIAALQEEMS
ncbi:MAG: hypothetical protein ABI867_21715 [Kofleriaceae bacterium]